MNSATGPEDLARALADVDRRVEVLRGQVEAAAAGEERRWATREIVALASRFVAADEEVLLPATAEAVGESGAGARREEQERLEELLAQLARTAPEDDAVVGSAARLAAAVHAHVTALGADLARLDGTTLAGVAARYDAAMQRAPTRPHPADPKAPGLARAAHAVEGVADRVRDAVRDAVDPAEPASGRGARPSGRD